MAADTIDLHGQFVEEAEDILEARIRDARAREQAHLHVIVGKGNNSTGGVQKLKPRVERVCREMGLDFATEENAGRIYIDLTGGNITTPPPIGKPPHHNGDQPHQGQPPQEQDRGLVWWIFRKLEKACCIIM